MELYMVLLDVDVILGLRCSSIQENHNDKGKNIYFSVNVVNID